MTEETIFTLGATPDHDRYLTLGRAIARQCPPGFEEAKLRIEAAEEDWKMGLEWTAPDGTQGEQGLGLEARAEIRPILEEVRTRMASEDEGPPWRRCVVTLRKGGHFRMDVE